MPPGPPRKRTTLRKSKANRINGVDMPYDPEFELDTHKDKPKPSPLFPYYHPLKPPTLTSTEQRQIVHTRALQEKMRNGPLYSALFDPSSRISKVSSGFRQSNMIDPFHGMVKYSQRYTPKKRNLPKLEGRGSVLEFFPRELWGVLDPSYNADGKLSKGKAAHKSLQIVDKAELEDVGKDKDEDAMDEDEDDIIPRAAGRKRVDNENGDDGEDGLEGEDMDDDFEDEEEGGDYDAEQYFDDGGDDGGEDYDAGGEGSGYFE